MTALEWTLAAILIGAILGGLYVASLAHRANAEQLMRMHPSACPHGWSDWDKCPDCCH